MATTYVPKGLAPSKRQAKRIKRLKTQAEVREAKRFVEVDRPMSSLDRKAKELGVWSEDFHKLSRKDRHSIVARAFSMQKSA